MNRRINAFFRKPEHTQVWLTRLNQNGQWRAVNNSMRAAVDEMAINAIGMKQVLMVVFIRHRVSTFRHPHADCHGAQSL